MAALDRPKDWRLKFMTSGNDMKAASETYGGFTSLVKWGSIIAAIITAFVVAIIA